MTTDAQLKRDSFSEFAWEPSTDGASTGRKAESVAAGTDARDREKEGVPSHSRRGIPEAADENSQAMHNPAANLDYGCAQGRVRVTAHTNYFGEVGEIALVTA